MTPEPGTSTESSSHPPTSALLPVNQASRLESSVRSRSRAHILSSGEAEDDVAAAKLAHQSLTHLGAPGVSTGRRPHSTDRRPDVGTVGQFLGDSLAQGLNSVQDFASMLISAGGDPQRGFAKPVRLSSPSRGNRSQSWAQSHGFSNNRVSSRTMDCWGPSPPTSHGLGFDDGNHGAAASKAAQKASLLENTDGANGDLATSRLHKRRNSDEMVSENSQTEYCLVYIHHVEPDDTLAGLVLRYQCREDVFRKANGLWTRDSLQTRKWLAIPVDTCDVRGRPCESPTPDSHDSVTGATHPTRAMQESWPFQKDVNDHLPDRKLAGQGSQQREADEPWTHVRWVRIDSLSRPVQIGRIARHTLGYFPPRRKKSIMTASSPSTPRQEPDMAAACTPSPKARLREGGLSSPGDLGRLLQGPAPVGSQAGAEGDERPAWMRRPGGVGSMNRRTRVPGPDGDYLNSWAKRHLPGLNIEDLPSMSIMGSETAHFGFVSEEPCGIVESPFMGSRDSTSTSRQGTSLDKAAAAVESWLRGALTKRPGTPLIGGRGRSAALADTADGHDLIELTDTASDDDGLFRT